MESRARPRPAGSCSPTGPRVECHSPENWPQLFIRMSLVPAGGSAHLCPLWGRLRGRSGSATTPDPYSLPTRGRRAAQVLALPVFRPCSLPVIGLAIWIKVIRLQALASASSCEVQNGPQNNPAVGSVWVRPRSCLNDAAAAAWAAVNSDLESWTAGLVWFSTCVFFFYFILDCKCVELNHISLWGKSDSCPETLSISGAPKIQSELNKNGS